MKIEKRKNSYGENAVLIAHNDMAVFLNKREIDKFDLRVTGKQRDEWVVLGNMDLTSEDLKAWVKLLSEL